MQCGMKDFITKWRFYCRDHTNDRINRENSFIEKKKFINVFAMLLTDAEDECKEKFLRTLIKNIFSIKIIIRPIRIFFIQIYIRNANDFNYFLLFNFNFIIIFCSCN